MYQPLIESNRGCQDDCGSDPRPDGLCPRINSVVDQLPLRCVGDWAFDKIAMLHTYFEIFARGMNAKWGALNYVEICSGPGRCIERHGSQEFDGTALAILKSPAFRHIQQAVFVDRSEEVVTVLNSRIRALGPDISARARAVVGDYKDPRGLVRSFADFGINKSSLNLVFVDPTDCSVPFSTMRTLHQSLGRTDFIVNFPFGTDLNRNVINAVLKPSFVKAAEKYLDFLGDPDFFQSPGVVEKARLQDLDGLKVMMNEKYFAQLGSLGYRFSEKEKVRNYYYLCFFSSNERGLDFWRKATKVPRDGQRELF